jgi:adenylyltransferase/sulfurtransferase
MPVEVLIPSALRQFTGNSDHLSLDGRTVAAVLSALTTEFPQLRHHLFDDEGKLRSFVNVYVNDEDVRYLSQDATSVKDGDRVMIVPAVAGGSAPLSGGRTKPHVARDAELSRTEIERYSRHLLMPEVAMTGQKKLKNARVLIVGAGGLGSPLAIYLAAAGVGHLGLVDFDVVDHTNLQRQVLHFTPDVGRPKLASAAETIHLINPHVEIDTYETRLTSENAMDILESYDVIADGTDNFATRYLVNDACVMLGKPNVYGSIFRFEGQASVFCTADGPCYRCLYPSPPPPGLVPSCAEGGVLGVLPGTIGLLQATEAIKLLLGIGRPLVGRLVLYNALDMEFREVKVRKNPNCPVCGEKPTIRGLIDYEHFCGAGASLGVLLQKAWTISPAELHAALNNGGGIHLLDVREPHEYDICHLPNSILIPAGQLSTRIHELDRSWAIVAYCRSGVRSAGAVKLLREAGFGNVRNLTRGVLGWADDVDPTMAKY